MNKDYYIKYILFSIKVSMVLNLLEWMIRKLIYYIKIKAIFLVYGNKRLFVKNSLC